MSSASSSWSSSWKILNINLLTQKLWERSISATESRGSKPVLSIIYYGPGVTLKLEEYVNTEPANIFWASWASHVTTVWRKYHHPFLYDCAHGKNIYLRYWPCIFKKDNSKSQVWTNSTLLFQRYTFCYSLYQFCNTIIKCALCIKS